MSKISGGDGMEKSATRDQKQIKPKGMSPTKQNISSLKVRLMTSKDTSEAYMDSYGNRMQTISYIHGKLPMDTSGRWSGICLQRYQSKFKAKIQAKQGTHHMFQM